MRFDRKTYFDLVRESLFYGDLTQQQVDGQEAILTAWEQVAAKEDLRWLAYMLATTIHETASTMWPIEEYGKGQGHEYGKIDPETGKAYYGRGLVQLTWAENYQNLGERLEMGDQLYEHPELALSNDAGSDPTYIATRIMFIGMKEGIFTGRKLADYFSDTKNDAKNARQIINGNDKDTMIAGYHDKFLSALQSSKMSEPPPVPDTKPPVVKPAVVTIRIKAPPGVQVEVIRE